MKPYVRNQEKINLRHEVDSLYEFLRDLKWSEFDACSEYMRSKQEGKKMKAKKFFQEWQDIVLTTHNKHEKHHCCHCFELNTFKVGNYIFNELIC